MMKHLSELTGKWLPGGREKTEGCTECDSDLKKTSARYLKIGAIVAVILNPVFGIVDFLTLPDRWPEFLMIRSVVTMFILFAITRKKWLETSPMFMGMAVLVAVVTQDSYFLSQSDPHSLQQSALAFVADFVGAGLVLLWPLELAAVFMVFLVSIMLFFQQLCSGMPLMEYLAHGALLVLASALFCMVMVVFRYHSLLSILVSRSELIRSNEFMTIQNEIIREKSDELVRSNARLREFAHMVSHDLKTPLRGISNLAGWIREDCADTLSREGVSHLEMIDRQIQKMEKLIKGILDYSKSGNDVSSHEWISLDDLIHEVIETVDVNHLNHFVVQSNVPVIRASRVVVSQVLQNLISNSIKHNDKMRKEVRIHVSEEQGFVRFSVSDNGPGIEKRNHARVFDLFQTLNAENDYECTGIGLPVSRKMIEESGGSMWLESEFGKGAVFHFTLPDVR